MVNKKATLQISLKMIGEAIASLALIILLIIGIVFFSRLFPGTRVDCENEKWWTDDRGVEDKLKLADKGENTELFFFNEDCYLVSFTFAHGIIGNPVQFTHEITEEPQLCLCQIDDNACKPYDCYKFKSYDQINTCLLYTSPSPRD